MVETKLDTHGEILERIERKLDTTIECKADKSEVKEVRDSLADKASEQDVKDLRRLFYGVAATVIGAAVLQVVFS